MDARTMIGLLIFIVCAAVLERSVMNAMWNADDQDGSDLAQPEDGCSKEIEPVWRAPAPTKSLASLKLHRTG